MTTATESKSGGFFYGWWVLVGTCLAYAISAVGIYFFSIFFPFIGAETGWTRADLGFVMTAEMWVTTAGNLVAGWMVDKLGGRWTLVIGAGLGMVGLVLLSTMTTLTQVFIYYALITGMGIALQSLTVGGVIVRRWFFKRAAVATGIMSAGFGVTGAILIPMLTRWAASIGWRPTLMWTAIVAEGIVALYAALVVRNDPESQGMYPDGDKSATEERAKMMAAMGGKAFMGVGEALRTPQLWFWLLGFSFSVVQCAAFLGHLPTMALGLGAEPASVGLFMTYWLVPSILCRIGTGWLGDRLGKKRVTLIAVAISAALFVGAWLFVKTTGTLMIFCIAAGFFMVAPTITMPPMVGDLFGVRSMGTIMGTAMLIGGVAMAFGPTVVGMIADATGTYNLAFLFFVALYVVAFFCVMLLKPTKLGTPIK